MDSELSGEEKYEETVQRLQHFLLPSMKPGQIYTDNSLDSNKACEDLVWTHDTSTPHRPSFCRRQRRHRKSVGPEWCI